MMLRELIAGAEVRRIDGGLDVEISGLAYDSRQVAAGDLFFATARDATLRRTNIEQALNRGARALVVRGWDGAAARPAVTIIEAERPRLVMGAGELVAAAGHGLGAGTGTADAYAVAAEAVDACSAVAFGGSRSFEWSV